MQPVNVDNMKSAASQHPLLYQYFQINQHSTCHLSKAYSFGNLALDQHGTDGELCINLYEQELIRFIVSLQHNIILDGSTFWGSDIIMKCSWYSSPHCT